jgi:hypothetical protein
VNAEHEAHAIRRALRLTEEDEAVVREAAPRLVGEVERWVQAFHVRLAAEPIARALLRDGATALRVRRALAAWFQELLSLPYDAAYERSRREIGRVHLNAGMPQHMMVTAMSWIRRDVRATVARVWAGEPDRAARVADAVEKVLDLELALMLDAFRRREREVAHRTDLSLFVRRAEARATRERADAVDAASCYLSLLRRSRDADAGERHAASLSRCLEAVARPPRSATAAEPSLAEPPRSVSVAEICAAALEQVSAPPRTTIELSVVPTDARFVAHETVVRRAVEELVQVAVNRDPGGAVRLAAIAVADGGLLVEVSDGGPEWPEGARGVEEALGTAEAYPVAFGDLAAELHGGALELVRTPGRGGGLRLRLPPVRAEARAP